MRKAMKLIALLLVFTLVFFTFAACGGKTEPSETPANNDGGEQEQSASNVKGTMDEHGYYKVFVPDGYTLVHEDLWGDNNPEAFNLNDEKSFYNYFMFNMFDEDGVQMSLEATRSMNENVSDVSVTIGGKVWSGVAYDSSGIPCYSLYADFDGNYVFVSGAGNAYDSELVSAVLSSLEVNVTE